MKKRNIVIIILSVCLTGMTVYAAYTTITLQQMKAELEEERVTVFDAAWIHTDNLKSTTERNIQEWSKYPVEIDANLALRIGDAVISDCSRATACSRSPSTSCGMRWSGAVSCPA